MAKTITVHTVTYSGADGGPAGDGTQVIHYRNKDVAQTFASTHRLWGSRCEVQTDEVPRHIAERWVLN
jgi:hypothetical protein